LPSHSAPIGAPGAGNSMILRVPPYWPALGDAGGGVVLEVVVDVVGLGAAVVVVTARALEVGGELVVTAGVLDAGVADGEVPELQPTTTKAQISKIATGMINFLNLSSSFIFLPYFSWSHSSINHDGNTTRMCHMRQIKPPQTS